MWLTHIIQFSSILSLALNIVTLTGVIISNVQLRRMESEKQKWVALSNKIGTHPGFLLVDIRPGIIVKPAFNKWINKNKTSLEPELVSNIDAFVREVTFNKEVDGQDDINTIVNSFRKARYELLEVGINQVHLFYRGPVALISMLGAELSNGAPVIVYHYDSNSGEYITWGPLQRPYL